MNRVFTEKLAVCSWSLQPARPEELADKLLELGIPRVQLALDPLRENPNAWGRTAALFRNKHIDIVSGMFGCVGEDYSTLETIRVTGGIAPDSTWEQNRKNIATTATLAHDLGLKLVTFHAGFLPHDEKNPDFSKMLARLREVADTFRTVGIVLGLETGQETAPVLVQLLQKLDRQNVGVNFDPANMILYDKGDPIQALQTLGPWIRQVHIKDAIRTKQPDSWGQEVPAGSGEVNWRAFFDTLNTLNFSGPAVIEREAGNQRVADIGRAKRLVEGLDA